MFVRNAITFVFKGPLFASFFTGIDAITSVFVWSPGFSTGIAHRFLPPLSLGTGVDFSITE